MPPQVSAAGSTHLTLPHNFNALLDFIRLNQQPNPFPLRPLLVYTSRYSRAYFLGLPRSSRLRGPIEDHDPDGRDDVAMRDSKLTHC